MTDFEKKVNEYRENKRLMEELESINDAIKADIIAMMQGAPEMVQGTAKAIYKDVQSVRLDSKLTGSALRYLCRVQQAHHIQAF